MAQLRVLADQLLIFQHNYPREELRYIIHPLHQYSITIREGYVYYILRNWRVYEWGERGGSRVLATAL
jgi:hypothetical protein